MTTHQVRESLESAWQESPTFDISFTMRVGMCGRVLYGLWYGVVWCGMKFLVYGVMCSVVGCCMMWCVMWCGVRCGHVWCGMVCDVACDVVGYDLAKTTAEEGKGEEVGVVTIELLGVRIRVGVESVCIRPEATLEGHRQDSPESP